MNINIDSTSQFPPLNQDLSIDSNSTPGRKLRTTFTIIDNQRTFDEHSNQEGLIQLIDKGSPSPTLHQDYYTENNSITLKKITLITLK